MDCSALLLVPGRFVLIPVLSVMRLRVRLLIVSPLPIATCESRPFHVPLTKSGKILVPTRGNNAESCQPILDTCFSSV